MFSSPAAAQVFLTDSSSAVYYNYGLVAGERLTVKGGAQVTGNIHSNGTVHLLQKSSVLGDASAAGKIIQQGNVSGAVTPNAPRLSLPRLFSKEELRARADRVLNGNQQLTNVTVNDVLFVDGSIRVRGSLNGHGTLIAAGDIVLEGATGRQSIGINPGTRLSLIAFNDVRIEKGRALRGAVLAGRDVDFQMDQRFDGVAVAGRSLSVDKGSRIQFLDLDQIPPVVTLVRPPDGGLIADARPVVEIGFADDLSGVRLTSLVFLLDGSDRTAEASVTAGGLRFTPPQPLSQGRHSVQVTLSDHSGNQAQAAFQFTVDNLPPSIVIGSPADGASVNETPIPVTGTVTDASAITNLTVNGQAASLSGGAFTASIGLTDGANAIVVQAIDAAGNTGTATVNVTLQRDTSPPVIVIVTPAEGQVVSETPISVTGTVTDESPITSLTVNGQATPLSGNSFSSSVDLADGSNAILVRATDAAGNTGSATVNVTLAQDSVPPQVTITAPLAGAFVLETRPPIDVTFSDESGIDAASLALAANGNPLPADCQAGGGGARCTPSAALPEGSVTLTASIRDTFGNLGSATVMFLVDTTGLEVAITGPGDGLITRDSEVIVTGTVSGGVTKVEVNGVLASLSGGGFDATVPLREGTNMVVALATKASGRTGTATIEVTRDLAAPTVRIDSPRDGLVSVNDRITVTGVVNDIVAGGAVPRVLVNGVEATVANGSFVVVGLPLVRGPNSLEAVANDAVGNTGRHAVTVTFQRPIGARLGIASGDGQSAFVKQTLTNPLVAVVTDDLGNPVAGRLVRFEVTRNSGTLRAKASDAPVRVVQVPTDGGGRAAILFTLGDTAGEGNNRVVATAVGVAGEAEFCASAFPTPPDKILMTMGDNQRGVVGQPLPMPLTALVTDQDGNPVQGVDVTFRVVQGTGHLDGATSVVRRTGIDGHVRAVLTLGLAPGITNNVVSASYEGLTGLPATWTASGLAPGDPARTRFSGVVLDNAQTPIPGAVVNLGEGGPSAVTDDQGQFLIENVPVGHIHLHIDPSGSPRPETFPPLAFETVTVAGQNNNLGQPILIPALDMDNSRIVGGDQDVILTMEGVEGFNLQVFANSVTFPDGSKTGRITVSQVHLDKVPMAPPNGTIFMPPAWTLQPPGVHFDPPIRVTIPNNGLPPGRVIDLFQFDHHLNQFISIGPATVSADGATITSDPGFGITAAGWGGGAPPPPPQTCVDKCPVCHRCTNNACVKDEKLDKNCCSRAEEYEGYRKNQTASDPRNLFASALTCVADGLCKSASPAAPRFEDSAWTLCVNKELFVRWKSHSSLCWKSAELACQLAGRVFRNNLSQQVACFAAQAACHDGVDMLSSMRVCGCGTSGDWDKVGDVVGDCSSDIFDTVVETLSKARKVSGCE